MAHFVALNESCHVSAQCTSVFRSCCSDSASSIFDYTKVKYRVVREKANLDFCVFADIVYVQKVWNMSGPNTVPWGIPYLTGIFNIRWL